MNHTKVDLSVQALAFGIVELDSYLKANGCYPGYLKAGYQPAH